MSSQVVGATGLARLFGRSRPWAKKLLREWAAEQDAGGKTRVIRRGKNATLYTTMAVVHQELPSFVDLVALVRKVAQLERDVDFLTQRLNREIAKTEERDRHFAALTRAHMNMASGVQTARLRNSKPPL